MTKVAYNSHTGVFCLSLAAVERMIALGHEEAKEHLTFVVERDIGTDMMFLPHLERHDPILIQVVEELEEAASPEGRVRLHTVKGDRYRIDEGCAGTETVVEPEDVEHEWIRV